MPRLNNMLRESGVVEIPVPDDDPLVVHYRRDVLTPRLQARMSLFQGVKEGTPAAGDAMTFFCEVIAKLITSWNLTDDNGAVIGTDAESLQDVQIEVLTLIMTAIGKEMTPDPLSGRDSSNGSSPTADSEPRQIGMAS